MSDLPPISSALPPVLRPRSRWRRILLALLIFLGGGACGAAAASAVITRSIHHAMHHPEAATAHITARLTSKLNLTDAQSNEVRQIIRRRQNALIEIRRDIQPRVEIELSALEEEIASVLDDEQRDKWHVLADHFRAHWLPPVPASVK